MATPPVVIKSLSDFVSRADALDPFGDLVLFRGQSVQGNLLPGIARKHPERDTTKVEKDVLDQLELQGASFLRNTENTKLDRLVIAQHFGLKTRLLDWTSNPLAALWFACVNAGDAEYSYVYLLQADQLLERGVYDKDPFEVAKTRVIQPRLNNARITAQSGWFTLHRYSKTAKRFVPLDKNPEAAKCLFEFRIPKAYRGGLISSLDRLGISYNTLFPDLQGVCQHLNWKHLAAV